MAMFGLRPDPQPSEPAPTAASMSTPSGRFVASCLQWARADGHLHTQALPGNALPPEGPGLTRFDGHMTAPTRASELAYVGLVAVVACWLVLVIADRVRTPGGTEGGTLHLVGWGLGAVGCLAIVAAWVLDRRARTPVTAVVDTSEDPVTEQELRTWQARGRARLWVFSQRGFEGSAVAFALAAGIRCLTPAGAAFVDAGAQGTTAAPVAARSPRERRTS